MLIEMIGEPATLELLAEECTELAHACLKLARVTRDENPTPKTKDECRKRVTEEIADVYLTMWELDPVWLQEEAIEKIIDQKYKRMIERLEEKCRE